MLPLPSARQTNAIQFKQKNLQRITRIPQIISLIRVICLIGCENSFARKIHNLMKLLNLRKLFAYLALSALLTLALLLVQRSETAINAFFGAKVEGRMAPDAGANFIKLILFMGLALQ